MAGRYTPRMAERPPDKPEYKVYRSRRGLLDRLQGPRDQVSQLREAARRRAQRERRDDDALEPKPEREPRGPLWRRIIKWVAVAVGAILAFAVEVTTEGFNLDTIGVILMVVGAVGFLASMLFWAPWAPYGRDRTVVHDREVVDRDHVGRISHRDREGALLVAVDRALEEGVEAPEAPDDAPTEFLDVLALEDLCAALLRRVGLRPRPVRSRLRSFS